MKKTVLLSLVVTLFVICNCNKENNTSNLSLVITTSVTSVTLTSAISGGTINYGYGDTIIERGICWSTNQNPTLADNKTNDGSGIGKFTSNITGLNPNTLYYVRAYGKNKKGANYGNVIKFTTQEGCGNITDVDGNLYYGVTIGTQCWFLQNLKTTKYNDGTMIPYLPVTKTWDSTYLTSAQGYCWYKDSVQYKNIYGALYNWYAVNTGKLCPEGWHVPSNSDWNILINYLGGASVAGGVMKALNVWNSPNTGATNSSGFSAMPGGGRNDEYGNPFVGLGNDCHFWSNTGYAESNVWACWLDYESTSAILGYNESTTGFSVRCVKNN